MCPFVSFRCAFGAPGHLLVDLWSASDRLLSGFLPAMSGLVVNFWQFYVHFWLLGGPRLDRHQSSTKWTPKLPEVGRHGCGTLSDVSLMFHVQFWSLLLVVSSSRFCSLGVSIFWTVRRFEGAVNCYGKNCWPFWGPLLAVLGSTFDGPQNYTNMSQNWCSGYQIYQKITKMLSHNWRK